MLVNRAFARRYFGGSNPLGKIVYSLGKAPWQIVGVVDDVRQRGPQSEPEPQFFLEYRQMLHALSDMAATTARINANQVYFAVRTRSGDSHVITDIRGFISQLDRNAALTNVAQLEDVVSDSIASSRFYATVLGIFAGAAVALAAIGIYGVLSYLVNQRTREIGIRIALGAKRNEVLGLILRQSSVLTAVGVLLGFGGAVALNRYVQSMLFGTSPLDPETFAAAAVVFGTISLVASYVPARRATKVDPVVALRYE